MQHTSQRKSISSRLRNLIPNPGNVIFTILMISTTLWAQSAGAIPLGTTSQTPVTTIPYQGYLADSDGHPISGLQDVTFKLYTQSIGGQPIWTEGRTGTNAIQFDNGFFNVMLGNVTSLAQSLVTGHELLYLGIAIGNDGEMTPRISLSRTPSTMIQSGRVGGNKNDAGWTLIDGTGPREYKVAITFNKPFAEKPNVIVSLSHIDILEGGTSHRLSVYPKNVTETGFDLIFFTWDTTRVWQVNASWIAHTSP